jgi:CheY-like chemotaxis protein
MTGSGEGGMLSFAHSRPGRGREPSLWHGSCSSRAERAGKCANPRTAGVTMEPKTILLAEDDPYIRRVSEVALRRAGFTVTTVGDGTEALQVLEDLLPDVVILDGMMPKIDGLEACRRIRASARTCHIPVIILSARSQQGDEAEGRRAGAIGYIKKPFDAFTLGDEVRRLCAESVCA